MITIATRTRHLATATGLTATLALLAGCALPAAESAPRQSAPASNVTSAQVAQATTQLAGLTVAPRGPRVKHARSRFGTAWKDVDRSGCDQRNEALARALTHVTFRQGSTCVVISGRLADPYTGDRVDYVRGGGASVDIDHIVPLGHAIRVGAAGWTQARREAFAGDLKLELLAVSATGNRAKADAPPDGWLPSNKSFRCAYAVRWVAIKHHWQLTITTAEKDTLARLIARCPSAEPRATPRAGQR